MARKHARTAGKVVLPFQTLDRTMDIWGYMTNFLGFCFALAATQRTGVCVQFCTNWRDEGTPLNIPRLDCNWRGAGEVRA